MLRRQPRSTRTDTLFPYTTLFRSYSPVQVSPLLLDLDSRLAAPDPVVAEHLARTRAGRSWLFVGRLAPNKCQHDVIAAFAAYRMLYDRGARLTLVGSEAASSYADALPGLVDALGVTSAVPFSGPVPDAALAAHYATAAAPVSRSPPA